MSFDNPYDLNRQHLDIAAEISERAETLIKQIEAGEIDGFHLLDHEGNPDGPACSYRITPFGLKICYVAEPGGSGIYLTPGGNDPHARMLIHQDLDRQICRALWFRQTDHPTTNRWPELLAEPVKVAA